MGKDHPTRDTSQNIYETGLILWRNVLFDQWIDSGIFCHHIASFVFSSAPSLGKCHVITGEG